MPCRLSARHQLFAQQRNGNRPPLQLGVVEESVTAKMTVTVTEPAFDLYWQMSKESVESQRKRRLVRL